MTAAPIDRRQPIEVFSRRLAERHRLGVETIYEGYLVHYGRPRLFAPPTATPALLLGDYLYAHGLVRIAAAGDVAAVRDLAELISLCAHLRGGRRRRRGRVGGDGGAARGAARGREGRAPRASRRGPARAAGPAPRGRKRSTGARRTHGLRLRGKSPHAGAAPHVPGRCGRRGPQRDPGMLIVGLIFIAVIALGMLGDHLGTGAIAPRERRRAY